MATEHAAARRGIILVAHGAVAKDCPRDLVFRFKALQAQRRGRANDPCAEEAELDRQIRRWPRTPANDPYGAGLEALAAQLRRHMPGWRVAVAYNEFCAPTIDEAAARLVEEGVQALTIVPSMLTPGGIHSEVEIPAAIERLRQAHPTLRIRYAWPFDLRMLAQVLAQHVERSS
jgi:sirohydrochlorin cobaltochelatase